MTKASAFEKERRSMQSKTRRKVNEVSVKNHQMTKLISTVENLPKKVISLQTDFNKVKNIRYEYK